MRTAQSERSERPGFNLLSSPPPQDCIRRFPLRGLVEGTSCAPRSPTAGQPKRRRGTGWRLAVVWRSPAEPFFAVGLPEEHNRWL